MKRRCTLLLALFAALVPVSLPAESYDLLIRHGRVVDGTGNPAFFADLAISNGRIAAIGRVDGTARTEIDAAGLVVAPGFIDVHTHADEIAEMPKAENFVRMGVTTVVAGNCGGSRLDLATFFRAIERTNVAVNVATLVGFNSVREKAMGGSFDRPPTAQELSGMKSLVERAMKDGAVGLSTGLIYHPGVFATTDEIVELAKVIAPYGGIYATHMRHEDDQIYSALDEVFRIAREAGVRAEVSHIKLSGPNCWGQADRVLACIEKARAEGLDVTQDQYAYTASSTGLSQLIPDWAREGGRSEFQKRLADPAQKATMVAQMKKSVRNKGRDDYSYAVIASCRSDKSLNGLNIAEAAKAKRGSGSLDDQIEMILAIQAAGGASGVFHGMSEDDLKLFMRHPNTMVASDSGLRKLGEGMPHPRGYGNNARVLARYVRELKVLRLEDAIRKMTSLPANTFHFKGRGQLREGNWADIVIFDPEKVQDTSIYKDPHHYPTGIPHVLVNGVPVIKDSEHTGAKAGQALRRRA
ncbi:MAG TPA: D-aminoacylase [Candidatus Paceibacterota bacterium]|nr:D-aminoacylase [Verrucomicrobiota bacterium]HSA09521.1 D-aminoacylase [Candidatus Paceibacterota bacterium]